jgi:hypothetical protein
MTTQLMRPKPLTISESLELDLKRATDILRFRNEQIRVLKLANHSLAAAVSPEIVEYIEAGKVWRTAIDPLKPDGAYAAEQRLLAALAAVEESK